MKMHIASERAVGSLHEGERAYLGISNRTQAKLTLRAPTQRAPTQRALQRIGEHAKSIGTKSSWGYSAMTGDDRKRRVARVARFNAEDLSSKSGWSCSKNVARELVENNHEKMTH